MNDSDSAPVISGAPYNVIDVNGHAPAALADFTGEVGYTAQGPTTRCHVTGVGSEATAEGVHFNEKADFNGRDIRIWQITQLGPGGPFQAVPVSNF